MIYHEQGSALNQEPGAMKAIAAHRHVEFVVSQNYVLNPNGQYADIVLPITTPWEKYAYLDTGNREVLLLSSQVTQPLFEARDDIWVAREIGRRLGIDPQKIDPIPLRQQIFNGLKGASVIKEDGKTWEPLLTITAGDIAEMDVRGEPQIGRISLEEFKERGIYQVPRRPGDNLGYTALEDFRKDPVGHRLPTSSGKFEIHSKPLSDFVRMIGFDSKDPIPKYEPAPEGYEETFLDWNKKAKGEYPLQLITPHYPRRAHTVFDNIPQLREAFPQEFMMNSRDAAERGIKSGDVVLIRSRHGKAIRPVLLTERAMPGVTLMGQGAWIDVDESTGIDRAGSTNVLNGAIPTGSGHVGWNTCIVQVEKDGRPLPPDSQWPKKIPLSEAPHA
jgi:anaerobic dimethyl sulfoxide reductase subunit A